MIKGRTTLTPQQVLERVSSYDLFKKYCPNFRQVGVFFSSEFRSDTTPSAVIIPTTQGLCFKDFGENDKMLDILDYIKKKFGVSLGDAIDMVMNDVEEFSKKEDYIATLDSKIKAERVAKSPTIIDIKVREFSRKDLEYWEQFGWTRQMLIESKTIPISHFWIDNDKGKRCITCSQLAYSYEYYFHNGIFRRKIYQPKSKLKWVSNVDDTIVQLVDVMPKNGDILFITSSKKDAGVFWRLNLDGYFKDLTIHGVAPNTEASFVPNQWLEKQLLRWKRIILFYDSDEPGIRDAQKYADLYGLEYMHTPVGDCKDPSDYVKKYGLDAFFQLLSTLLNV